MIDAKEVTLVVEDCLFKEEEIDKGNIDPAGVPLTKTTVEPIMAQGVVRTYGFHPERLEKHRTQIIAWLNELPAQFHKATGGGWSFLNACMTKDDEQWGEQYNVEQLMCLGIAIGKVSFPLPKEFWGALPGGVPYFTVEV